MRYLTVGEVLEIYNRVMEQSGGSVGVLDLGTLESAVAQPRMIFDGKDLYPTIVEKASSLGFSLIQNHPFVDGNKRTGHAALETFLMLNGYEISAMWTNRQKLFWMLLRGRQSVVGSLTGYKIISLNFHNLGASRACFAIQKSRLHQMDQHLILARFFLRACDPLEMHNAVYR